MRTDSYAQDFSNIDIYRPVQSETYANLLGKSQQEKEKLGDELEKKKSILTPLLGH
jgi:hypothetical protein